MLIGPQLFQDKGASAGEWAKSVTEAVGGKAGGKGPQANGSGPKPEKIEDAVDQATKYMESMKL